MTGLAIISSGMITCGGLSAPSSCAAIRAGIANFTQTVYMDQTGEWIIGGQVPLEAHLSGRARLVALLQAAIEECLSGIPKTEWPKLPAVVCVAEVARPGRLAGLEQNLLAELLGMLGTEFHPASIILPEGRVSCGVALLHARRLLYENDHGAVLVVGADSYFVRDTMAAYEEKGRLFTRGNSNGAVAGEGGAAILVSRPTAGDDHRKLEVLGLGFGMESASIESSLPLRADGLCDAIKAALHDAQIDIAKLDYRIADLSGEQYFFKEASLAITRLLRSKRAELDLWHPADCIGDTGAAAGIVGLCVGLAASEKGYAPGPGVMLHCSGDDGKRTCVVAWNR